MCRFGSVSKALALLKKEKYVLRDFFVETVVFVCSLTLAKHKGDNYNFLMLAKNNFLGSCLQTQLLCG